MTRPEVLTATGIAFLDLHIWIAKANDNDFAASVSNVDGAFLWSTGSSKRFTKLNFTTLIFSGITFFCFTRFYKVINILNIDFCFRNHIFCPIFKLDTLKILLYLHKLMVHLHELLTLHLTFVVFSNGLLPQRLRFLPRFWIRTILIAFLGRFVVFTFAFFFLANVFPKTGAFSSPIPFFSFFAPVFVLCFCWNIEVIFVNIFCITVLIYVKVK